MASITLGEAPACSSFCLLAGVSGNSIPRAAITLSSRPSLSTGKRSRNSDSGIGGPSRNGSFFPGLCAAASPEEASSSTSRLPPHQRLPLIGFLDSLRSVEPGFQCSRLLIIGLILQDPVQILAGAGVIAIIPRLAGSLEPATDIRRRCEGGLRRRRRKLD